MARVTLPNLYTKRKTGYWYLRKEEREIMMACDKILAELEGKPLRVTGWLKGGIDVERMLKLKEEIEERERKIRSEQKSLQKLSNVI